jgi:hypothetical protein
MTAPATASAVLKAPPPRYAPPDTAGADHPNGWFALGVSIAVLALLSSATGLGNGFAYDDRWIIVENDRVHSLHQAWRIFNETYWPNIRGAALYRPLTILLYAVQWTVGHGSPKAFHAVNVALYVTVSVLVLWLALQCLPRGAAWVAAALFAVHPVHVEAVGNVVGQAELWTALTMVGAVALYVRDRRNGLPLARRSALLILGSYVFGMLVKENAIVLPALIVAAELFLVKDRRPWRERADPLTSLMVWMGLLAAVFLWVRVRVTGEVGGDVSHPALHNLGMGARSLVMLGLVPEFGRLFVWPAQLYADYSPQAVPIDTTWQPDAVAGALMLACLGVLFLICWRRAPIVSFGLAWLAIGLAPVSNVLIPTGILLAERTLLVPSVGVVLIAGFAVARLLPQLATQPRLVRLAAGGALALVLTLAASESAERQYTWKSGMSVFQTLVTDAPLNFKSHYTYGGWLFEQKRSMDGEREWRKAIALMPDYDGVYVDLAHKNREGHICRAAIPNYQKGLSIEPSRPLARVGLVACYLELAQWHRARSESRSAIADGFYRRAFDYMIEVADSGLMASDSLDATNTWTGHHRILKP